MSRSGIISSQEISLVECEISHKVEIPSSSLCEDPTLEIKYLWTKDKALLNGQEDTRMHSHSSDKDAFDEIGENINGEKYGKQDRFNKFSCALKKTEEEFCGDYLLSKGFSVKTHTFTNDYSARLASEAQEEHKRIDLFNEESFQEIMEIFESLTDDQGISESKLSSFIIESEKSNKCNLKNYWNREKTNAIESSIFTGCQLSNNALGRKTNNIEWIQKNIKYSKRAISKMGDGHFISKVYQENQGKTKEME
ncbi:uncharacterized protein LOC111632508, partial [Centruroides sculpturatus]|uniref:uncharacterized protein LOC111632508 n=1 Tax=Centruroides sculpturatus TaxID=218467 RepID=UPI000C6D4F7B